MVARGREFEKTDYKEHKVTFWEDGNVLYLVWDNTYMSVYLCQTLETCVLRPVYLKSVQFITCKVYLSNQYVSYLTYLQTYLNYISCVKRNAELLTLAVHIHLNFKTSS